MLTLYSQEIVNQGTWPLVDINAGPGRTRAADVLGDRPRADTLITASRRLRELGAPQEFINEIETSRRAPPIWLSALASMLIVTPAFQTLGSKR